MRQLLKQEIQNNPENGKIIVECTKKGDPIPDEICNYLIEQRLRQSDCRVNGWVLEGFPESNAQFLRSNQLAKSDENQTITRSSVSYTHLRAHET